MKIKTVEKVSNHKGYNNQPCFVNNDDEIFFTSDVESNNKMHICSYNIHSKKTKRLSITNTSEYSDSILPNQTEFSVVMVEEDSTQRIWVFDLLRGNNKYCLSQQTDSVGYYTWLSRDSILYYKLTKPHSLHVLNIKTNQDVWLCDNPTRSFKKTNEDTFFYVIYEERQNEIYLYNTRIRKATQYAIDNISANQDYIWHPTLGLLKSEENKIYRYSTDSKVWVEIVSFYSFGIKRITRFTISNNEKYIALVSSN
ncbi:MAG: TolB-like translocation protein [Bacteroidia bacterium]